MFKKPNQAISRSDQIEFFVFSKFVLTFLIRNKSVFQTNSQCTSRNL